MELFTYNPLTTFWIDMAIFYYGFVLYAGLQTAIAERRWFVIGPCIPIILCAGLIDVIFNQTFGRLLFWEFKYTLTLSQRLDLHYKEFSWRGDLSRYISKGVNAIFPNHIVGQL